MEYVDGSDLKAVIEYMKKTNRPFPVEAAAMIAVKICEGLAYAHELRSNEGAQLHVVHRDMSPPNVLITKHGEVKIVDFGLAKASSQLEKSEAGIIKGKFSYLSPEAALGQEVDHRTDIFAVGIILWEMLAGRRLFLGDSDFATVKLVQQAQIPQVGPQRKDVTPELERILARALARDPAARYQSARDLGRDLTVLLYRLGRPISAFDIAELVRGAMALRKRTQPDKASIIDKLIEEALFEFTSLQDDKAAPSTARLDEPLKLSGFEDIGKWADEINVQAGGSAGDEIVRKSLPMGVFEEGNLAALEEDEPISSSAVPLTPMPSSGPPAQGSDAPPSGGNAGNPGGLGSTTPSATAPFATSSDSFPPPASGGTVKALLVVAAIAVIAAGAWFGHLIPH